MTVGELKKLLDEYFESTPIGIQVAGEGVAYDVKEVIRYDALKEETAVIVVH